MNSLIDEYSEHTGIDPDILTFTTLIDIFDVDNRPFQIASFLPHGYKTEYKQQTTCTYRQLIQQDQYNHQQLPSENMVQYLFKGVDEGKTSQTCLVSHLTLTYIPICLYFMSMVGSIYMHDQKFPFQKDCALYTSNALGSTLTSRSTVLLGPLSDI